MNRGTRIVRIICTVGLSMTLVTGMGAFSFAAEIPDVENTIGAEKTAEAVEEFADTGEVGEIVDTGEGFVDNSGDATTTIPKDGEGFVTMEAEDGDAVGMSLPTELDTRDGIATDNGTVVYQTDESAEICVQSITDDLNGVRVDGMRELVTIRDKDAPREYTFNFDLPEGSRFVTSEEYRDGITGYIGDGEEMSAVEPGLIYVVDADNVIRSILEAPWARDANGNDIDTWFSVDGAVLTQHIAFGADSAFPIIADPCVLQASNQKKRVRTNKLTRAQVKTVMKKLDKDIKALNDGKSSVAYWIIMSSSGLTFGPAAIVIDGIAQYVVVRGHVKILKERKTRYKAKYDKMGKRKLKVVTTEVWHRHGSSDGRYVLIGEKLTIV